MLWYASCAPDLAHGIVHNRCNDVRSSAPSCTWCKMFGDSLAKRRLFKSPADCIRRRRINNISARVLPRCSLTLENCCEVLAKSIHLLGSTQNLAFFTVDLNPTERLLRSNLTDDGKQFVCVIHQGKAFGLVQQVFDPLLSGLPGGTVGLPSKSPESSKVMPTVKSTPEIIGCRSPIRPTPMQMLPATSHHLLNRRVLVCVFPPDSGSREMANTAIIEHLMKIQSIGVLPTPHRLLNIKLE